MMGDTLWVEVRDTRTSPGPGDDNSIMLQLQRRLDRLCEHLQVAKLSDFYDSSELAAQCLEWMRQDAETGLLPGRAVPAPDPSVLEPRWFDPGPALAAVRALIAHLEQHPDDLGFRPDASRAHWPDRLMEELRGCASALTEAVARGQPFRFLLVS
jgi:hypothetical protein